MATIVEYSVDKKAENAYPIRIVSPPAPKLWCTHNMERVGEIETDEGRTYYYRRCRICGYTVRHFPIPVLPERLAHGIDYQALVEIFAERQPGQPFEIEAEGLLATCIQHEIDHLDGKVFVDYLSRLKQTRIRKKLEKQQRLAM